MFESILRIIIYYIVIYIVYITIEDQHLSTWRESLHDNLLVANAQVQSSEHLLKGVRFQYSSKATKLPKASGSTKGGGSCVYVSLHACLHFLHALSLARIL